MQVITDQQAKTNIAGNVARLRGARSRGWLAREVGTYPIHITRIERGDHMPTGGLLARLATALNVTADELLGPCPKPRKKSAS